MMMIKLSLAAGLRISEVLALRWEELEPDNGAVKIRILNGKDRILFISPGLYEDLHDFAEKHSLECTGVIFRTTKGKPVKDAYVRKMMRQKAVKAGIAKIITFHSLRHTALTRLYEKTKDIRLVQEVAGHANISTTMINTHISGADIREAMINF
jgi:integrase